MLCVSNLSQFPTVAQCSSVFAAVEVRITLQGIWHAKLQGHCFGLWSQIKVTTDTAAVSVTLADKQGNTYGTPIHVYAPRMKVIQTWVFRRCTLPASVFTAGVNITPHTACVCTAARKLWHNQGRVLHFFSTRIS